MIDVIFVCLGNICRSPMAEAVFRHVVDQAGLSEQFTISSAGTGNWHVGERPHRGTLKVLKINGVPSTSRAQQVTLAHIKRADYVIAMDTQNFSDLQRMARHGELEGKLFLLLDFVEGRHGHSVPDPYYTGHFDETYDLVTAGSHGLLERIRAERGL